MRKQWGVFTPKVITTDGAANRALRVPGYLPIAVLKAAIEARAKTKGEGQRLIRELNRALKARERALGIYRRRPKPLRPTQEGAS